MNERSGRPNDGGWDDGRLAEAYRSLAARPAPGELVGTTIAAAEAAPRAGRWWGWAGGTMRRPRFAAAGGLLAAGLVAILIGSLALRSTPSQGASGKPALAAGLTVRSVSELLAAEANGSIHGDDLAAVRGWIVGLVNPTCPYEPPRPALEDTCTSRKILLTETPQTLVTFQPVDNGMSETNLAPSGPYIYARELTGNYVDAAISSGLDAGNSSASAYRPLEAILVGHFHDVRAAECTADQRAACSAALVVDQVAWLDGKALGPNVWIGGHAGGQILNPHFDAAGVASALAPSLHSKDTIVSMAAVQLIDITTITGAGNQVPGMGEEIVWYVRVAGPPPQKPVLAWGNGIGGWLVVEDATGKVLGAGGWGFVPANLASYSPKPNSSPLNGLYQLPTMNWLPSGICAGVGLDAVLRGSPTDARVAWIERAADVPTTPDLPMRLDVTWPAGYHARFTPKIEILDENGNVVLNDGDAITGACVNNPDGGLLYLEPPFR
jgi:hypothetical protein